MGWFLAVAALVVAAVLLGLWLFWYSRDVRRPAVSWRQPQLPGGVAALSSALFQATGMELLPGHRVEWVDDARLFTALREEVERAQRSVNIVVWIWKPGSPGEELVQALLARARAGVQCRVLVDPMGSVDFEEQLAPRLREGGCQVLLFRPVEKRPVALLGRNHRKVAVVDGRVGFTGGFGIAPEWMHEGPGAGCWRDVNVRVEGPAVRQMQHAFAVNWLESGGLLLEPHELEPVPPAGEAAACFITSTDVKGPANAAWLMRFTLGAAERQLWIASAYFIPHEELLKLLVAKRKQGVDVRLLLPGTRTDQPLVLKLQRGTYRELLDGGVRIFEYQPSMMHAKTVLVDGRVVVVGSVNFDPLSLGVLEEGALVAEDAQVAAGLAARWEADLADAVEVTWENLPRVSLLGWLSRRLRWLKGER